MHKDLMFALFSSSDVFRPRRGRIARVVALAGLAGAVAAGITGTAGTAAATTSHHLPAPLPSPKEPHAIEGFAPYQPQFFCRSHVLPGVKAFEQRVLQHYRVSHSDGDMRACSVAGTSEHKDGRAWDWGVDHRIPAQRAAGKSMLRWLFATDKYGDKDAMFRRLGLMYIIWNKRIWGAWSQRWEPYSCSGPTLCHVNHMHFSFGWAGAEKRTSYWTHRVGAVEEPPLPHLARMHAVRHVAVAARGGEITAHWLVVGAATYRATATGTWRHGSGRHGLADAACTRTAHGWAPSAHALRLGGDRLQLWGARWTPVHNTGNGCNTRDHTYRMQLSPGALSTLTAELPDGSRSDDSGTVHLSLARTG